MFKNMLKRSWLSICRKFGRTIVLTLIFFMMANLVLATITIKTAVSAQMDYAKQTLGGTVTIQADMDTIRTNQRKEIESGADRKEMFGKMERPQVEVNIANEIALKTDYVKDYSYEVSSSANSNGLETVEAATNMPSFPGMPGSRNKSSSDTLDSDITISGVNSYGYISAVKSDSMTIKDGTYFDEDTDGKAMISYEFAELNSLKVGDKIKLKNIYTKSVIELEIIGIYDTSEEFSDANTIYLNTTTAAKFLSSSDYNSGNYKVSNVNFYMLDSEKAQEFADLINSEYPTLAENNLKTVVDTTQYDNMADSIESVGSFATTILIIVIIAAIIIITLIVTLNVRDRRYEIGVLLSLGAHKRNVLAQIITELAIIGTFGFVLASASGTFLAKAMGQSILESQNTASTKQSERSFGRPTGGMGMPQMPNMPDGEAPSNMKQKMASSRKSNVELDINATPVDFLLLFVTGYLVIIVALIMPSINIMRYQPKEILAGKE
jgi:putative ABC transport system permease protein